MFSYCQQDLLNMGWTKGIIKKLLPEPEVCLDEKTGKTECKLWDADEVNKIMQSNEFKVELAKISDQRKALKQSREAKKKKLLNKCSKVALNFDLQKLPNDELTKLTNDFFEKMKHNSGVLFQSDGHFWFNENLDENEDARKVEYIYCELTPGNELSKLAVGQYGVKEIEIAFKDIIYDRIISVYPEFMEICKKRKEFIRNPLS